MRRASLPVAAALSALALSGCVSLLPKSPPVQLYALQPTLPAAAEQGTKAANVRLGAVGFEPAAAGDRMLTLRGAEAAYIANARWMSPAQVLFNEDLKRVFSEQPGGARLVGRGDMASSSLMLTVDVERFRIVYGSGGPAAEVVLHAQMVRFPDRSVVMDTRISKTEAASADRVSAFVEAYDKALGAALGDLVQAADQAATAK